MLCIIMHVYCSCIPGLQFGHHLGPHVILVAQESFWKCFPHSVNNFVGLAKVDFLEGVAHATFGILHHPTDVDDVSRILARRELLFTLNEKVNL